MTGFARAEAGDDAFTWAWEIKSVNGRGLDVRLRLPSGHERLESPVREAIARRFARGSLSVFLELKPARGVPTLRINRELLEQIVALHRDLAGKIDPSPPRLEGLLAVRGVVEAAETETSEAERARRDQALLRTLDMALDDLAAMRADEGRRLEPVLGERLAEIARLAAEAEGTAALQPEARMARLREQVEALLGVEPSFSEERLAQEAAMIAVKSDVREELDRLKTHVAAARELLRSDKPVGRRLDFLCQELNREANTLCSKSTDMELTRIGLALKAAVEQLREQVQNIE